MKRPACPRAPQAEALEDGRLSSAERASFERHAASCAECASELRALMRLRHGAEWLPETAPTPLEHRRQQQALLRRASELLKRGPVQPRRRTFALVLSCALVAAVCIGFALGAWRSGSDASVALAAPTYRLDASPGASWQTIEAGATLRLRLGSGSFMLEVDKLTAVQRFVLELPDGELEVIGTQFGVRVEREGTRRVEVTEGRVALRLRDALPISLGPGESWTAEREAAQAADPRSAPADPRSVPAAKPTSTPAPAAAAPSERSRARARQTAPPETKRALVPPSGEQAATTGTPNHDFARAMAAFGAGDYGQAERLFQDFERRHPDDARQEDSTFLRAVACARRGDTAGARATARQYLERYPHGLRAPEAERLAESPK
jgi:TolA-binding protein